ncbi:hypothetical protein B0T10DRAFT_10259 [Thelonectria olida]|uniref:C2H2-type domain-containing protein n=1 Tax=Thelonectria olida TaxID=1576542 RepID=A0A9P8WHA0_9HYPO|nr:hypothetical protein B0T10DRAFT_10259 [Thelonectria olida]
MNSNYHFNEVGLGGALTNPPNPPPTQPTSYVLHQQPFQGPIDPNLDTVVEAQPMQRFMQEKPLPFSNFEPSPTVLQYPSLLSQPQGQGHSPNSQYQLSGTSSAQSPRTESDMLHDGPRGPFTPPGMKSPHFSAVRDIWDSQGDLFGLASHDPQYVNPSKILPNQGNLVGCHNINGNGGFPLDRGPSLDVCSSMQYEESIHQADLRLGSPATDYPDPDEMDVVTAESPAVEEEDEDWKPTPSRRSSGSPKKKGRGRPKGSTANRSKVVKANPTSRSAARASSSPSARGQYPCAQCPGAIFSNAPALKKHARKDHKRSFICILQFAGCNDAFSSKNEWKRHVATQHLNTRFWLCTHGTCKKEELHEGQHVTNGRPFKRKDLFTQHARRMHVTSCSADIAKQPKNRMPGLDDELQAMQEDACHKRCDTPEFMQCPGEGCFRDFCGEKAWDEYLEHIASDHLDPAGKHHFPPVQFGSARDKVFTDWASSNAVNVIRRTSTGWEMCDVLKDVCLVRTDNFDDL